MPGGSGLPPEAVGRAVAEYLEVLDDAAFGGATPVTPKRINLTDPASRWTAATREAAFYAYSTNYLIDLEHAVIVDVEATTSVRQAEVTAQRRMIERTQHRFPVATVGANASSGTDYEQLTYDAASNVTGRRLRDGQTITYGYDNLNRRTFMDRSNVGIDEDVSYGYDLLGRLVSSQTPWGHRSNYAYDALGRVVTDANTYGTLSSRYDLAGRRTRLTWSDGFFVDYDSNVTGEITAIRENGATSGIGVLATYAYDDLGRRTSIIRGNGTITNYSYDAVSRLSNLSQDLAGSGFDFARGLTYNPAGQIITIDSTNDTYAWQGHFNVDRSYAANGLNQTVKSGAVDIGYDGRGNLITSGASVYTYGQLNNLVDFPGGSFYYDPENRLDMIYTPNKQTSLVYDRDNMVAETTYGTGALLRRYVPGPGTDEPVVWYEGAGIGDRRWLHADERGSVVAVSDASGNTIGINRYDEYGIPASTNIGRFQYTGQAWLPELGMYYYKARMYSPTLGRFMQTDPIGYGDGMNNYNYVGGDPINKIDPSGLCEFGGQGYSYTHTTENGEIEYVNSCPPPTPWYVYGFSFDFEHTPVWSGGGSSGVQSGTTADSPQSGLLDRAKKIFCSIGNIDLGGGADGYAGLGGSVGGSFKLDLTTGQTGIDGYLAAGVGLGVEAGPTVTSSSGGNSIITANVITQAGGGYLFDVVGTRTLIGTNPGQNSVTVGKVGSPIGFVNGGAAIGFHTPKLWDAGC